MRKLVTQETVAEVRAIPDADAIEAVIIGGWTVVAKKGEFARGDTCAYFEIDSALPLDDPRFAFLAPRGSKTTVEGNLVHVLKTARLRGVYSQGLALPINQFPELSGSHDDIATALRISKWEPPVPASMNGEIVGPFPTSLARKTDAERVQNLSAVFDDLRSSHRWIATEKIDGTSVTFINDGGALRVCGRNWEVADGPNLYWDTARELQLAERLPEDWVVQAEIFGEGIQANPLKVRGQRVAVYGCFDGRTSIARSEWPTWLSSLAAPQVDIDMSTFETVEALIEAVDGMKSCVSPDRLTEGVVFHTADGSAVASLDHRGCFKVISNKYLLKHQ